MKFKWVDKVLSWLDTKEIFILFNGTEKRVQTIFDKVIAAGHYSNIYNPNIDNSSWMCTALFFAERSKVITSQEHLFAKQQIKRYLQNDSFLSEHLKRLNHPAEFSDRLKIYKNWSNRPFKKLEVIE